MGGTLLSLFPSPADRVRQRVVGFASLTTLNIRRGKRYGRMLGVRSRSPRERLVTSTLTKELSYLTSPFRSVLRVHTLTGLVKAWLTSDRNRVLHGPVEAPAKFRFVSRRSM